LRWNNKEGEMPNDHLQDRELPDEDLPVDPYELDAEPEDGATPDAQVDWDQPLIKHLVPAEQMTANATANAIDATYVTVGRAGVVTPSGIAGERAGVKAWLGNSRVLLLLGGAAAVLLIGVVALSGDNQKSRPVGEPVTALQASNSELLRDGGNPGTGTSQTYPADADERLEAGRSGVSSAPGNGPNPLASPTPAPTQSAPSPGAVAESERLRAGSERISQDFTINTRAGEAASAVRERQAQESALSKAQAPAAQGNGEISSGNESSPVSPVRKPKPVPFADLVRGQRIMLNLTEPFRTGVATMIQAQVLNDVYDKTGKIIFPVGATALIPMAAPEANGRAIMVPDGIVVFQTAKGEYGAMGELKGSDGYVGLKGSVKNIRGQSRVKRALGGAIDVAAGAIGRGAAGSGVEGELSDTVRDESYELNRTVVNSNRVVEVSRGTNCALIVR
jgi:hypothetical protein